MAAANKVAIIGGGPSGLVAARCPDELPILAVLGIVPPALLLGVVEEGEDAVVGQVGQGLAPARGELGEIELAHEDEQPAGRAGPLRARWDERVSSVAAPGHVRVLRVPGGEEEAGRGDGLEALVPGVE